MANYNYLRCKSTAFLRDLQIFYWECANFICIVCNFEDLCANCSCFILTCQKKVVPLCCQ